MLVGDHYQLPPLVVDSEARDKGMGVSLFKRLSSAHPQAVVQLEHQYRMNAEIMDLSNSLVYGSRLKCGMHGVATSRLALPGYIELASTLPLWIQHVVDPALPVVFVDTDDVSKMIYIMQVILNTGLRRYLGGRFAKMRSGMTWRQHSYTTSAPLSSRAVPMVSMRLVVVMI